MDQVLMSTVTITLGASKFTVDSENIRDFLQCLVKRYSLVNVIVDDQKKRAVLPITYLVYVISHMISKGVKYKVNKHELMIIVKRICPHEYKCKFTTVMLPHLSKKFIELDGVCYDKKSGMITITETDGYKQVQSFCLNNHIQFEDQDINKKVNFHFLLFSRNYYYVKY